MGEEADDPVMALLDTQRAVLTALENMAARLDTIDGKIDALSDKLDSAAKPATTNRPTSRSTTLGERFRAIADDEPVRDAELEHVRRHFHVARMIARALHPDDESGLERELTQIREWLADQSDRGRRLPELRFEPRNGASIVVLLPIHEEMFGRKFKHVLRDNPPAQERDRGRGR